MQVLFKIPSSLAYDDFDRQFQVEVVKRHRLVGLVAADGIGFR
jgi:hypothetical protein